MSGRTPYETKLKTRTTLYYCAGLDASGAISQTMRSSCFWKREKRDSLIVNFSQDCHGLAEQIYSLAWKEVGLGSDSFSLVLDYAKKKNPNLMSKCTDGFYTSSHPNAEKLIQTVDKDRNLKVLHVKNLPLPPIYQ